MTQISCLLSPDDSRWTSFLDETSHDIYHLPAYARVAAIQEGGQACAMLISQGENKLLIPLILRAIPSVLDKSAQYYDAVSPYGYACPLIISKYHNFDEPLPRLIQRAAEANNIVSVFLRLHPFLPSSLHDNEQREYMGQVVWMDLHRELDLVFKEVKNVHKRAIKKLRKLGYTTRSTPVHRASQSSFIRFVELYRNTMKRVGAKKQYMFSTRYFEELFQMPPNSTYLLEVMNTEQDVVCSVIFTVHQGIVQYHLSGTADEELSKSPLKLALWNVAKSGAELGGKVLCLGGGVGAGKDNLYKFKAAFSPLEKPYETVRIICSNHYYKLTDQAAMIAGKSNVSDFFPAYRALLPSTV